MNSRALTAVSATLLAGSRAFADGSDPRKSWMPVVIVRGADVSPEERHNHASNESGIQLLKKIAIFAALGLGTGFCIYRLMRIMRSDRVVRAATPHCFVTGRSLALVNIPWFVCL